MGLQRLSGRVSEVGESRSPRESSSATTLVREATTNKKAEATPSSSERHGGFVRLVTSLSLSRLG